MLLRGRVHESGEVPNFKMRGDIAGELFLWAPARKLSLTDGAPSADFT